MSNDIDSHIGTRIRWRRLMLGVSRTALAAEIGVTRQRMSDYEHGTFAINASRLFEIADALETEVAFFFERKSSSDPCFCAGSGVYR